jgi:hypothetical protein
LHLILLDHHVVPFRGSITRPVFLRPPVSDVPCGSDLWSLLLTGWLGVSQVGLSASTRWRCALARVFVPHPLGNNSEFPGIAPFPTLQTFLAQSPLNPCSADGPSRVLCEDAPDRARTAFDQTVCLGGAERVARKSSDPAGRKLFASGSGALRVARSGSHSGGFLFTVQTYVRPPHPLHPKMALGQTGASP